MTFVWHDFGNVTSLAKLSLFFYSILFFLWWRSPLCWHPHCAVYWSQFNLMRGRRVLLPPVSRGLGQIACRVCYCGQLTSISTYQHILLLLWCFTAACTHSDSRRNLKHKNSARWGCLIAHLVEGVPHCCALSKLSYLMKEHKSLEYNKKAC